MYLCWDHDRSILAPFVVHGLDQVAVLRIIQVHVAVSLFGINLIDDSHTIPVDRIGVIHFPTCIKAVIERVGHRLRELVERCIRLVHHPLALFGEPCFGRNAVVRELGYIIISFNCKERVGGIGIFLIESLHYRLSRFDGIFVIVIIIVATGEDEPQGDEKR